jgi:hypothetical protein
MTIKLEDCIWRAEDSILKIETEISCGRPYVR